MSISMTPAVLFPLWNLMGFFIIEKVGNSQPLFLYFSYFQQLRVHMFIIIFFRWLDGNHGPLELEATGLPTKPQPLPWTFNSSFAIIFCHIAPHVDYLWLSSRLVTYGSMHVFHFKNVLWGQEPWSSGKGKRLTFRRSWVRIPAPYTGWTFFPHIFVVKL